MLNKKRINIIFATSAYAQNNRLIIGKNGNIPWAGLVPSDMMRFKRLTSQPEANSVVMGRKTWDSIPEKFRPFDKNLPPEQARQTLILTKNEQFEVDDPRVVIAHSLDEAAVLAKSKTIWIAGGAEIYALALPFADELHITMIHQRFNGDTFFPFYDVNKWKNTFYRYFKLGKMETDQIPTSHLSFERL